MKIGDPQKIMGMDAVVSDVKSIDGIDYELYAGIDKGGAIRILDVDSSEVVTMKHFKTFNSARTKFHETIALVV